MKNKKERLIIWASIFIIAQYILTFFIFHLRNRFLWQALGWFIWFLSLHWIVFIIGLIASSLIFMDIQAADQQAVEKFGEPYQEYMKTVPQVNFIVGITRKFRR